MNKFLQTIQHHHCFKYSVESGLKWCFEIIRNIHPITLLPSPPRGAFVYVVQMGMAWTGAKLLVERKFLWKSVVRVVDHIKLSAPVVACRDIRSAVNASGWQQACHCLPFKKRKTRQERSRHQEIWVWPHTTVPAHINRFFLAPADAFPPSAKSL